jgi:hypothetical protein
VTFIRDGIKVFEMDMLAVTHEWDPKLKAVPIRFTIPHGSLEPEPYDCQITVLEPTGNRRIVRIDCISDRCLGATAGQVPRSDIICGVR